MLPFTGFVLVRPQNVHVITPTTKRRRMFDIDNLECCVPNPKVDLKLKFTISLTSIEAMHIRIIYDWLESLSR